eukprot:6185454-Pleurochrysis_carterae.AAC.2
MRSMWSLAAILGVAAAFVPADLADVKHLQGPVLTDGAAGLAKVVPLSLIIANHTLLVVHSIHSPHLIRRQLAAAGSGEETMTEEEKEKELEEEEEKEIMTKWSYVVGITALFATLSIGFILESNHIYWLPEAGVGVLMGLFCALGAKLAGNEHMLSSERFDFEFFMTWLLPPIIFEAGFNMNVAAFFDNAGPTVFFAFVGTFASTFIVGGLVFYAGQLGLCYALDGLAALTFGSLISATDPVTVLAVFQALGVKIDLFSMVFGESVLNDAVAIVLSNTLVSFLYVPVSQEAIIGAVLSFLQIFIGSMVRRAHPFSRVSSGACL